jgi:hypothetical protein
MMQMQRNYQTCRIIVTNGENCVWYCAGNGGEKARNYCVIKVLMDRTIGRNVIRRNITTDMKIGWDGDIKRVKQNINQIWIE